MDRCCPIDVPKGGSGVGQGFVTSEPKADHELGHPQATRAPPFQPIRKLRTSTTSAIATTAISNTTAIYNTTT